MPKKKNAVSRFIHDTDRFVLIIIGILLAMLPIVASVFGGVVLAGYFEEYSKRTQALFFVGLIVLIAILTFINVKKKLGVNKK